MQQADGVFRQRALRMHGDMAAALGSCRLPAGEPAEPE